MLLLMVNNSIPREKQVSIAKEIKESTGEDCILLESGAVELSYIQTKEEKEKEKQEFLGSLSTLLKKLLKHYPTSTYPHRAGQWARREVTTMVDTSRHTYEDFRSSLERFRFSDAIKNTILHRAEQEGELTYDQMMALYAYAYPEE